MRTQLRIDFQDLATRYPHFYADISALILPNRVGMLLHLRRYSEIHERLLFGTDYRSRYSTSALVAEWPS